MLAKQIVDELKNIIREKNLSSVKRVDLEIGNISMSHDGHPEHLEEINLENLDFGLKGICEKEESLKDTKFNIKKVEGDDWRIVSIDAK